MALKSTLSRWVKATILATAVALSLVAIPTAKAITPSSTYSYTDTTYKTIQDADGNQFGFVQTGCGFLNQHNTIPPAKPYDPAKIAIPDSDYCENGTTATPADAYWQHDPLNYIVVPGSSAQAANAAAQAGVSGAAKLVVFDSTGNNPQISDIQLSPTTLAGAAVGTKTDADLDGNCRQGAGVLSWLICPMVNLANNGVKFIVGYVLDLLKTDPLLVGNGTTRSGLYDAWNQFRIIANILLVPIFLISIYAMLFSSNNRYTVTKLLPRLVVAALLMQVSFYIAAFIIDVGNVLGAGIAGIFNTINEHISPGLQPLQNLPGFLQDNSGVDRGVGAAVGVGMGVALGWLFLSPALPALLIILVSFIAGIVLTFLALALRQLAIVVLVVLAPIVFVLAILPNMERWMREWFDNLMKLVFVYPLIVLFFSVASTLSLLARGTGQGEVNQFMASLLPIVALISVPLIFKFAGSLFSSLAATLSGVSGRAKGGIIGDVRDPGSLAFRARMGKIHRRYMNTMGVAGAAGLGWTGRFTQPVRKQRDYYRMGGESITDVIGTAFPDKLKRLVWGERAFPSLLGVEPYNQETVDGTNWFRADARRIRGNAAEFSTVTSGPLAQYAGAHFDRGMNTLFGIGQQVRMGTLTPDIAGEGLRAFQFAVKGQQRILGTYNLDDLRNPYVRTPTDLYNLAYGDYHMLPADLQDTNYQRKQLFIRIGSGTLTEQQGEGTYKAMADTLKDDRIIDLARSQPDDFGRSIEALVLKAESINAKFQKAGVTAEELEAMSGDDEVSLAGFYGKSGNEIRAMRDFVKQALEVKAALGLNTSVPSGGDYF